MLLRNLLTERFCPLIRASFCGRVLPYHVTQPSRSMSIYSEYYPFIHWKILGELDGIEFPPERRKLPILPRTPAMLKPIKHARHPVDSRGPEEVQNRLNYRQYGIQALGGGELQFCHLEMIRASINGHLDEKRMFAVWGVEPPWKSKTKRSQGKTLGGGKADIHHYVTPVKTNRIIVELGGYLEWQEAYRILKHIAGKLPFPARFISQEMLDTEDRISAYLQAHNVNPFADPRHAIYHNYAGCHAFISPYHLEWGTTVYR